MDYRDYYESAHKGGKLVEEGKHDDAIAVFHALVESDISDLDKANMCYNVAICCEKLNLFDDALRWYDAGVAYEQPYLRFNISEHKAFFLSNRGRDSEALAIYESLYRQPYLTEIDKERIWKNITVLRNPRPK